jgi:hypothetical protein
VHGDALGPGQRGGAAALGRRLPRSRLSGARGRSAAGGRGLPGYRLEAEHGQPWRSRYDQRHNEIVINSAHRDFLASRVSPAKHRRYIGKLYAKEVVLSNFPHESPAQALERLVEITLRTEDSL